MADREIVLEYCAGHKVTVARLSGLIEVGMDIQSPTQCPVCGNEVVAVKTHEIPVRERPTAQRGGRDGHGN